MHYDIEILDPPPESMAPPLTVPAMPAPQGLFSSSSNAGNSGSQSTDASSSTGFGFTVATSDTSAASTTPITTTATDQGSPVLSSKDEDKATSTTYATSLSSTPDSSTTENRQAQQQSPVETTTTSVSTSTDIQESAPVLLSSEGSSAPAKIVVEEQPKSAVEPAAVTQQATGSGAIEPTLISSSSSQPESSKSDEQLPADVSAGSSSTSASSTGTKEETDFEEAQEEEEEEAGESSQTQTTDDSTSTATITAASSSSIIPPAPAFTAASSTAPFSFSSAPPSASSATSIFGQTTFTPSAHPTFGASMTSAGTRSAIDEKVLGKNRRLKDHLDGTFTRSLHIKKAGKYNILITHAGGGFFAWGSNYGYSASSSDRPINCPFRINVLPASPCAATSFGRGTGMAYYSSTAASSITLEARDAYKNVVPSGLSKGSPFVIWIEQLDANTDHPLVVANSLEGDQKLVLDYGTDVQMSSAYPEGTEESDARRRVRQVALDDSYFAEYGPLPEARYQLRIAVRGSMVTEETLKKQQMASGGTSSSTQSGSSTSAASTSTLSTSSSTSGGGLWTCELCMFQNPSSTASCDMCDNLNWDGAESDDDDIVSVKRDSEAARMRMWLEEDGRNYVLEELPQTPSPLVFLLKLQQPQMGMLKPIATTAPFTFRSDEPVIAEDTSGMFGFSAPVSSPTAQQMLPGGATAISPSLSASSNVRRGAKGKGKATVKRSTNDDDILGFLEEEAEKPKPQPKPRSAAQFTTSSKASAPSFSFDSQGPNQFTNSSFGLTSSGDASSAFSFSTNAPASPSSTFGVTPQPTAFSSTSPFATSPFGGTSPSTNSSFGLMSSGDASSAFSFPSNAPTSPSSTFGATPQPSAFSSASARASPFGFAALPSTGSVQADNEKNAQSGASPAFPMSLFAAAAPPLTGPGMFGSVFGTASSGPNTSTSSESVPIISSGTSSPTDDEQAASVPVIFGATATSTKTDNAAQE